MTKSVSYTTPAGSTVVVTLIDAREERINLDGHVHNRSVPCWELTVGLLGKATTTEAKRITHPQHGAAVEFYVGERYEGKKRMKQMATAPIPAGKLAEVDALFAEYAAGRAARQAASTAAMIEEGEYRARYRHIASDGGAE